MEESKQKELMRSEKRLFDLIPRDILEFLCDNLSIQDQLQFSRVCKSSCSLVFKRPNPKARDTPWLIGLIDDQKSSSSFKTMYEYDDQVTCYQIGTKSFEHYDPDILGYFKGWLYVQYFCNNNVMQLVNLFTNIHIDLPCFSDNLYAKAFALSFCKSMRPIMIAIVSQYGDLALCKIGDSTWKTHHQHHDHHRDDACYYVNITFYHEKLYAVSEKFHKVDIFEIDDDLRFVLVGVVDSSQVIDVSLLPLLRQAYLVEDHEGNNLFLVMQHHQMFGLTFEFEIFKVEDDHHQFVKVDTLRDQILLLGDSCSEIINVKDCSNDNSPIFEGNQICFIGTFYHDVGIYSLKDETIIWASPGRDMRCLHWIFPRFTTTECNCKSHLALA